MRLNKYLALYAGLSRRSADAAIAAGKVVVDNQPATLGQLVDETQLVTLDGQPIATKASLQTIMLHKPVGYVCSRDGQGSPTVYDLLPASMHHLKPVGRLDKDSSGLLLLTNDGQLAHRLTHPSFQKEKSYEVVLDKPLTPADRRHLEAGVTLEDGVSVFQLAGQGNQWTVRLHEGRNRQIRRTFAAMSYTVLTLHRTRFGDYQLGELAPSDYQQIL